MSWRTAVNAATAAVALLALVLVPLLLSVERTGGPGLLFAMRGAREAPPGVVVVAIDRDASRALGLPNRPSAWPRTIHADLVRALTEAGAAVIAYDVLFRTPRQTDEDADFADAIRDAGNVILFQHLVRDQVGEGEEAIAIEQKVSPLPELADAAAGLAPFPLPKIGQQVDQTWVFRGELSDDPTLPTLAYHQFAAPVYPLLREAITQVDPEAAERFPVQMDQWPGPYPASSWARALRGYLADAPERVGELRQWVTTRPMSDADRQRLLGLLALHGGDESRYIDFYGPPRTVPTLSAHDVLANPHDLRGIAVFVGFSEDFQPQQQDGFPTVFSRADGVDLSGVEIAATVFGNILEQRFVTPLPPALYSSLPLAWALLAAILLWRVSLPGLVLGAVLMTAGYLAVSLFAFARFGYWLPVWGPLLAPLPVILIMVNRYLRVQRSRSNLARGAAMYLPADLVARLDQGPANVHGTDRQVYGVCLATDVVGYTRIAEGREPQALKKVMNAYYTQLIDEVQSRGGWVADVVGDAMLAVWVPEGDAEAAHDSALEAARAIMRWQREASAQGLEHALDTRIGVHAGPIVLGSLGGGGRYQYRAVGDVVNASVRLQDLAGRLGLRVLASELALSPDDARAVRRVGRFRVPGKQRPLTVLQVAIGEHEADESLKAMFERGLTAFQRGLWADAEAAFEDVLARYPNDGPARFYQVEVARRKARDKDWDGILSLQKIDTDASID